MKFKKAIQAYGDKVLVYPYLSDKEIRDSGIVVIKGKSDDQAIEGEVLSVGKGEATLKRPNVKVGEKVLFGRYSGDDIRLEGTDGHYYIVKIIRADSILGKVV